MPTVATCLSIPAETYKMEAILQIHRHEMRTLCAQAHHESQSLLHQWMEEEPVLDCYLTSLQQTRDIIKSEQKRLQNELGALKASIAKQAAEIKQAAMLEKHAALTGPEQELEDLQVKLIDMNNRLLDVDLALEELGPKLRGDCKEDERQIYETKLVVLQDTKRIMQEEVSALRNEILRRESVAKYEADRNRAEELGYGETARLGEQLARTEAKIDSLKQAKYFPEVKGYRFSGGSAGIYFAAKDLFLSEVSGRFEVTLEPGVRSDGSPCARLSVSLLGASAVKRSGHQQQINLSRRSTGGGSQKKMQAHATTPAQAPEKAFPEDPATPGSSVRPLDVQVQEKGGPGVSEAPEAQFKGAPATPPATPSNKSQPHDEEVAAPSWSSPVLAASSPGGHRRGVMVAKFLNTMHNKKDKLKQSLSEGKEKIRLGAQLSPDVVRDKFKQNVDETKDKLKTEAAAAAGKVRSGMTRIATALAHQRQGSSHSPMKESEEVAGGSPVAGDSPVSALKGKLGNMLSDRSPFKRGHLLGSSKLLNASPSTPARPPRCPPSPVETSVQQPTLATEGQDISRTTTQEEDIMQQQNLGPEDEDQGLTQELHHDVSSLTQPLAGAEDPLHELVLGVPQPGQIPEAEQLDEGGRWIPGPGDELLDSNSRPEASIDTSELNLEDRDGPRATIGFEEGPCQRHEQRAGLFITLMAHNVELIGERGTKVPNLTLKEIMLEVECKLVATVEFSPMFGWQAPERSSFEILHLERKVTGNNLPLPRTLIKTILNMVMPRVFTKIFLTTLPVELGTYIMDTKDRLVISGEFRVTGPPLASLSTPMTAAPGASVREASVAVAPSKEAEVMRRAQYARKLVGLTESQAVALEYLMMGKGSLLYDMASPRSLTLAELSTFYCTFSTSKVWRQMCDVMEAAMKAVLHHKDVHPEDQRFKFHHFMQHHVRRLVKKPMHVEFALDRLDLQIQVDGAVNCARDYFDRVARDFEKSMKGRRQDEVVQAPLEQQLEALNLWHQATINWLASFKSTFKSTAATLVVSADHQQFSFGAEGVHYEGPVNLTVPLKLVLEPDHALLLPVKLPNQEDKLSFILDQLKSSVTGSGARKAHRRRRRKGGLEHEVEEEEGWGQEKEQAPQQDAAVLQELNADSFDLPLLRSSVIGHLLLQGLSLAMKLDERKLGQWLTCGVRDGELLGSLLTRFGDLMSVRLQGQEAPAPPVSRTSTLSKSGSLGRGREDKQEGEIDEITQPLATIKLKTNYVTRLRGDLDTLCFQSDVAPRTAIRLLHAVIAAFIAEYGVRKDRDMKWVDSLFDHLDEYLSKETLEVSMALMAAAEVQEAPTPPGVLGMPSTDVNQTPEVEGRLKVVLSNPPSSGPHQEDLGTWPLVFINDLSLLTVLDTFKLLMDY